MYKLFFENNPLGSFIIDTDGKLRSYNKVFLSNIGFDEHYDLLGDNNFNFKNIIPNFIDISSRLIKDNAAIEFDTYLKMQDGSFRTYKINCIHFLDETSNFLILGSLTPILESGALSLSDERKKYDDIMNNSVQLIQSFNKDGMLLFVNKAWKDTFGYNDQEIQSINLFDIIAEEDKAHCSQIFKNILRGVPAFEIKATFISKLGAKILLKGNILPMLNNGELVATHAFFNDISELSVIKKELASKDVLLETIFKSIPVCLYLKDYEGKYVFANDMMVQTIGGDVIGKTDLDIFDKESAEIMKQTDLEAIASEDKNTKFTFINERNGEKKHYYCGKKPISTEHQKKLIFGYTVDITELRNNAAKVEESERILNQIVSNTNTGIMLFKLDNSDNSYKIDFINNTCKKIINYNEGKSKLTALLPELQLNTKFAEENGALVSQVYEYVSAFSGVSNYYDVFINRIDLPEDDHKLLVFFNDVTEKKHMIDNLELNLKENVVLLSEVHHRVKNNLANIYGIIELNKYKFQNTNFEEYLIEVQLKIKSIAVVHDLLYKSKSLTKIMLDDYFTELCHEYKKIYKSTQQLAVTLELFFDKNISIELGRAISLGLMLGELLSNSFKYASKNKEVTVGISIKLANGRCFIEYKDSGVGFETSSLNTLNAGFGMKLIQSVLKQIKANFDLNHDKNFNLSIDFEQI